MDINKIFGLFNDNSGRDKINENLEDFKKTPYFKIGMFKKLVMNGINFKIKVVSFFSRADEDFNTNEIDLAGEFMIYTRAWFWIEQIDWNDPEWVEDIKRSSDENFLVAVKLTIHYFEEQEEYEKCAFLKKLQDFIQENLED